MAKYRTLTQTYQFVKEQDTGTAITPNALRRMVITGVIPCIKAGKKYLIDLDSLFEHLKTIKPEEVLKGYEAPIKTKFDGLKKFK